MEMSLLPALLVLIKKQIGYTENNVYRMTLQWGLFSISFFFYIYTYEWMKKINFINVEFYSISGKYWIEDHCWNVKEWRDWVKLVLGLVCMLFVFYGEQSMSLDLNEIEEKQTENSICL